MEYFLVCKCPNWEHASELNNFCDWCLFCQVCCTFSGEFNELRVSCDILKNAKTFVLFYRITNSWNIVKKKVLDDFFEFLFTFDQVCL